MLRPCLHESQIGRKGEEQTHPQTEREREQDYSYNSSEERQSRTRLIDRMCFSSSHFRQKASNILCSL